ncbi:hypothetical protein HYW41_02200 [Candidatus Daviesbacteria bacterium]|nr:hypothetical protein [Candidatus Daviesbacteria bacterium]
MSQKLVFFLLSILITISWFKSGLYYGGAEVGISPYYNPARYLNIQQFIWWADVAPGTLVPQFISAVPLYFILSLLQNLLSPLMLQALVFFCLLFLMGYGMYLFTLSYIGKDKVFYAVIAGLFYMFNSYMLVEVWHRFLYGGFFLAAFLPILALFWKLWIQKGNFVHLVILLLVSLISSYMFGNLTSFIALWIAFFLLTLAEAVFPWQGRINLVRVTKWFVIGLTFFILTNLWWLIPVAKVSTQVLPNQHSSEDNISTLVNISKQTILPYILQYANPFYLFYTQELGSIYKNTIFLILPWIPAIVIFLGLLVVLKNKKLAVLGLFYLITIIIAKGAANPFGYPYIWGFMNTFFIGVIRNPFEKLGVLLPFFSSTLFVIGLEYIFLYTTRRFGKFISRLAICIILISILIFAFPMFTGRVFNKPDYPLLVQVPDTYKQADNWFKKQKDIEGNILHLPFTNNDVVTYNWEHGYHGVEVNEILFTSLPSITRNVGIKRVDDTLRSLAFIFNKPFLNNEQILNLLQSFNVSYIVFHKDMRWDDVSTYGKNIKLNDLFEIENTLNSLDFLENKASFGSLIIYKIKDSFYKPKIIFSNNYDLVDAGESNIMQTLTFSKINSQITAMGEEKDNVLWENSSQVLIFPRTILYTWEYSKEVLDSMLNKSIIDPNDDALPFNQLKLAKQRLFLHSGELLSETLIDKIMSANNLILELNKYRINQNIPPQSLLKSYDDQINAIFTSGFDGSSIQRILRSLLAKVFTLHLYVLERFYNSGDTDNHVFAKELYDRLNTYLINNKVLPKYFSVGKETNGQSQRRVHSFYLPKSASYELLITDNSMFPLYPDIISKLHINLDGNPLSVTPSSRDDFTHLTEVELDKGVHEISYVMYPSSNLVSNLNEFKLEGVSQLVNNQILKFTANPQVGSAATMVLDKLNGGDIYEISFEALTDNADKFYIEMTEDTEGDNVVDNCTKTTCYPLELVSTSKDWQRVSFVTTPLNIATRKANLRLLLPLNQFSTLTFTVQIRNLQINRLMDNNLILRKKLSNDSLVSSPSGYLTSFKKLSPVKYEGRIKLDKPSFMFFKETFNPGWKLELFKDNDKFKIDKHFLGNLYGNTYYIDKTGEYNFKLEFEPQKNVNLGIMVAGFGWVGILIGFVYSVLKTKQ